MSIKKLFSISNKNSEFFIINFLVFKIKFKNRKFIHEQHLKEIEESLFYTKKALLLEKFKHEKIQNAKIIVCSYKNNNLEYIFPDKKFVLLRDKENFEEIPDAALIWGEQPLQKNIEMVNYAFNLNIPLYIAENGFLRSAYCWADKKINNKFSDGISFVVDKIQYFDATQANSLEELLNNQSFQLNETEKLRAHNCINKIIDNYLTKYNHQPIYIPKIGRDGVKKILVIDQAYRDMSILKGLANDKTFENMLKQAMQENPDADIIVKTHPDIIQGSRKGYYQNLQKRNNIHLMLEPINPISLIKYCDKVYVCSSQFGFEALMCGKEVHVFGMPFYANWGITLDRQTCQRRKQKRSLEEIFYAS